MAFLSVAALSVYGEAVTVATGEKFVPSVLRWRTFVVPAAVLPHVIVIPLFSVLRATVIVGVVGAAFTVTTTDTHVEGEHGVVPVLRTQ